MILYVSSPQSSPQGVLICHYSYLDEYHESEKCQKLNLFIHSPDIVNRYTFLSNCNRNKYNNLMTAHVLNTHLGQASKEDPGK